MPLLAGAPIALAAINRTNVAQGPSSVEYRLYFPDETGQFVRKVALDCPIDAAAIAKAEEHRQGRAVELWNRGRLVKKIGQDAGRS